MSRYVYTLRILDGDTWTETQYKYHPTAELDKADHENKVWKLIITKRTKNVLDFYNPTQ